MAKGKGTTDMGGAGLKPRNADGSGYFSRVLGMTPSFEGYKGLDDDIKDVENEFIKEQRNSANAKKVNEHDQQLDLIRFAFSLLLRDLGSVEFVRINPLLVHSYIRAVMTDGHANDAQGHIKVNNSFHAFAHAAISHQHILSEHGMKNLDEFRKSAEGKRMLLDARKAIGVTGDLHPTNKLVNDFVKLQISNNVAATQTNTQQVKAPKVEQNAQDKTKVTPFSIKPSPSKR